MSTSEITEEKDEEAPCFVDTEARKERIRRILEYQKSVYSASSLSSPSAASCSSFSSSRKSSSLLQLMKGGSTSLRRLFEMEHTSLATYFHNYSGSPIIKPILLWGSDADDENGDPWASIKQLGLFHYSETDRQSKLDSEGGNFVDREFGFPNMKVKFSNRKLTRKKSFRRLPGFGLWRGRGFRCRLKLKRLRIMICGRKF